MQPRVVKNQAKKETQVTKNKFCKVYSDIEKKQITETKFQKCPFFKFHDFSLH